MPKNRVLFTKGAACPQATSTSLDKLSRPPGATFALPLIDIRITQGTSRLRLRAPVHACRSTAATRTIWSN